MSAEPFVFGMSGLPSPLPPIGPSEGTLSTWISLLDQGHDELTGTANNTLAAAISPEAWYGAAADTFRTEGTQDGLALLGAARGMAEVASVLVTYLLAAEQWDRDLAAAKAKDQDGINQENRVSTLYSQAALEFEQTQHVEPDSSYYTVDPRVWAKVAGYAEQTTPPEGIQAYVSPLKRQARKDFEDDLQTLALAGVLAASKINTVTLEATTVVNADGSGACTTDPLVGLRELGATVLKTGQDPVSLGDDGLTPKQRELLHEEGGDDDFPLSKSLEVPLGLSDIGNGSVDFTKGVLALSKKYFADDGTEGAAASITAGDGATADLAGSDVAAAAKYGKSEGEELTGAASDDPLVVERVTSGASAGVSLLGVYGDINTLVNTEDAGVHGVVTRASAIANLGVSGYAVAEGAAGVFGATWEIPGVDVATGVIAVGTGIYAIGNAIWDGDHPPHKELP